MNIGFFGLWGFGRGHVNINKQYIDALLDNKHNIFMYKLNLNEVTTSFKKYNDLIHITQNKHIALTIPKEEFYKWVKDNKLDAIIFNEYNQWEKDSQDLVSIAKEMGVKTYGILVWEKFDDKDIKQYKNYTRLLPSTKSFYRLMRQHKIRNKTLVPYSLELDEYPKDVKKRDIFTFIHVGGFLGAYNRKNTNAVIEAYESIKDSIQPSQLIITSQLKIEDKKESDDIVYLDTNMNRQNLLKLISSCHVSVLPSKWETIGIPILESMACGLPVITSRSPPMSELVIDNKTGLCAGVSEYKSYPSMTIMGAEIDVQDLANKMKSIASNDMIYNIMSKNALSHVAENYDWNKNKKILLELIENE